MKAVVVFNFRDGMSPERARAVALGIATMVNASVRGEPDITVNLDPQIENKDYVTLASALDQK